MARASKAFGGLKKKRWLEIARAYRFIAKNEWIDPMTADIQKIMFALRLASRMTAAADRGQGTLLGSPTRATTPRHQQLARWGHAGRRGRPELVDLPQGAPDHQQRPARWRMAAGGGSTYNISVNVAPARTR